MRDPEERLAERRAEENCLFPAETQFFFQRQFKEKKMLLSVTSDLEKPVVCVRVFECCVCVCLLVWFSLKTRPDPLLNGV